MSQLEEKLGTARADLENARARLQVTTGAGSSADPQERVLSRARTAEQRESEAVERARTAEDRYKLLEGTFVCMRVCMRACMCVVTCAHRGATRGGC